MADAKLTALGAIASVAGEDLVYMVDDPGGTPVEKKATVAQVAASKALVVSQGWWEIGELA